MSENKMTHISLFSGILSGGSILPLNGRDSRQSPRLSETHTVSKSLKSTGPMFTDAPRSGTSQTGSTRQLPLFPEAIRVLSEAERLQFTERNIPTCPDTSLPWSRDYGHGGWSARMFLHQMLVTLRLHWTASDTERLLQTRMPLHIRGKIDNARSLLDVLKDPGCAEPWCYLSDIAVRGLLRRCFRRRRSILVLLLIRGAAMRVMVTFGNQTDSGLRIETKGHVLPDFQMDILRDYLIQQWRECVETPSSRSKSTRSCRR